MCIKSIVYTHFINLKVKFWEIYIFFVYEMVLLTYYTSQIMNYPKITQNFK
jgi:hypothetical protein